MTIPWKKHRTPRVETLLESDLATETVSTEKLRVLVLLTMGGVFAVLSLIPPSVFSPGMESVFHGNMYGFLFWRFLILLGLFLYVSGEHLVLRHWISDQHRIPNSYRYLTALIETSFPTATMVVAVVYSDPSSPIATIPVMAYPLFIVLSALRLNFRLSLFTGFVAAAEYLLVANYLQVEQPGGFVPILFAKSVALVLMGVLTGLVALQIKKKILDSARTAEERKQIISMFGKHVSPVVVDQLLANGSEISSQRKDVCVMFLDIRNFTGFAEKRTPEEVVTYLETLFEFMIDIVNRNHGFINKFLGDGFMAVFGAPISNGSDCLNAVTAAQEILSRLKTGVENGSVPPTSVGIGLHAGEAVTGSIGSALRKEYTVIGDVVNLAARIEKLNKQFGSELLISDRVRQIALGDRIRNAIPKGFVHVRGREEPIQVFQLA